MNLQIELRCERIATLFFKVGDERHKALVEILAREMVYFAEEIAVALELDSSDTLRLSSFLRDHNHSQIGF